MGDTQKPFNAEFIIGADKFIYDFEEMTCEQCLIAETQFKLHDKIFKLLPATPNEFQIATENAAIRTAYASLLVKIDANGEPEPFSAMMTSTIDALKRMKGSANRQKLERCKADFFTRTGLQLMVSTEQLSSLMQIVKEMPDEYQQVVYGQMAKVVGGSLDSSSEMSFITGGL